MSVQLKRLKADYDQINLYFSGNSRIKILKTIGSPPNKYQIEYLVSSLQKQVGVENPKLHNSFIAEIVLTSGYPRMAPQCRMLTPVFHPNIAPHAICIGDHWAAGESLSFLISRIGEMLAFQSYNVKSPLNGEAAKWVEQNTERLPLDDFDFQSLLNTGEVTGKNLDGSVRSGDACSNCGTKANTEKETVMKVCINDHITCHNCSLNCSKCKKLVCLSCSLIKCDICKETNCHNCAYHCNNCGQKACSSHAQKCNVCQEIKCTDCLIPCKSCNKNTCLSHITKKIINNEKLYYCNSCESQPINEKSLS
jgi:ubiquitin-protein ligase